MCKLLETLVSSSFSIYPFNCSVLLTYYLVGDISYALPCMHPVFGIPVKEPGIFTHHWAFTEAAGTDEAHNAAVTAGKAICMVAFDVIGNDAMYETIRNDWKKAVAVAEADMD